MSTMWPPTLKSGTGRRSSAASLFAHAICISCLILQRFGLASAHFALQGSLIIVPLALAALIISRKTRIDPVVGLIYGVMLCCFLCAAIGALLFPALGMRFSILSIAELVIIYSVFIFSPAADFDSQVVLDVFIFYARICACAGILEFALQFVHVKIFSFARLVPAAKPVLIEYAYNTVAPLKYGSSILRSNGFFFLEPSMFSQIMALAVAVDYFVRGRALWIPVYVVAMLSSFSGTGPLALAVSLIIVGLMSPTQIHRTAIFGVMGILVTVGFALVFPAQFATLMARASPNDASAHLRYGLQLEAFRALLDDPRVPIGFGPGAADGFATKGSMSPALKLMFDYGVIGAGAFVVFLITAVWRSKVPVITIMCLVIFQLGGGYLLFPSFLFVMMLLCIWSEPVPVPVAVMRRARPMRPHAPLAPAP